MSNPQPARQPTTTSQPTRQQLDELDALMHRMLALPVGPGDPEPQAEPAETIAVTEEHEPVVEEAEAAPPATPTEFTAFLPPAPIPGPELSTPEAESSFTEPVATVDTEEPLTASPARPRKMGWGFRPLLWINRAFDQTTVGLGVPGRWLRGPRGRACMGVTGLLLLGSAVAWGILDWMGWPW